MFHSPCRQKSFAEHIVFLLMSFVALCIQSEIQPFVSKLPRLISCLSAHGSLFVKLKFFRSMLNNKFQFDELKNKKSASPLASKPVVRRSCIYGIMLGFPVRS